MWRSLKSSVAGTSHTALKLPCQDAHTVEETSYQGNACLVVAIADGAGTAKYAEAGARFSADNWAGLALDALSTSSEISEKRLTEWADQVRCNLTDLALREENPVGEYACTLLGAVITREHALFFQIGDGAWIAKEKDGYLAATWPTKGQYANEAVFITSSDSHLHYQTKTVANPLAIAGFTDGLENLALVFKSKTVHEGFFEPMFQHILEAKDASQLQPQLEGFLKSEKINERTDDDKTLVLIVRVSRDGAHAQSIG